MKALIRACIFCLAVLCLVSGISTGSADAMTQADYETIVEEFRAAMSADTSDEALDHLRRLCAYYEIPGRSSALEAYEGGTALVYYTYAKGIIAFNSAAYDEAWQRFGVLQDTKVDSGLSDVPDLPDTTYYYQFSLAMLYCSAGEYENAFVALETARTAEGASAIACRNAKSEFADALRQAAQDCCSAGNHPQAQAYYKLYAQYVSPFEGQALLKECEAHSQTASLGIADAESAGTDRISLSWTGSSSAYLVSWSSDLSGASGVNAMIVQGNSTELTQLFPGTEYRITIQETTPDAVIPAVLTQPSAGFEGIAETIISTLPADRYSSDSLLFVRSLLAGITRNETLLQRATPVRIVYEFPQAYHYESPDNAFKKNDLSSYALCCLISYRNKSAQDIRVSVTCILRSASAGAFRSEAEEYVFPKDTASDCWFYLDELLKRAEDAHGTLSDEGEKFAWEIYFDDALFCNGTFSIQ